MPRSSGTIKYGMLRTSAQANRPNTAVVTVDDPVLDRVELAEDIALAVTDVVALVVPELLSETDKVEVTVEVAVEV